MADIRDPAAFMRGRWRWSAGKYEDQFPRGCQFTDIDAFVEFGGRMLVIEGKHLTNMDRRAPLIGPLKGQDMALRRLVAVGVQVIVLWGDAVNDRPMAARQLGAKADGDVTHDWRECTPEQARQMLKDTINRAMRVGDWKGEK